MNAEPLPNPQDAYPDVPADRWWIVEFAIRNRGPIVNAVKRSHYDLSEDLLIDLLDQCAGKVALYHEEAWRTGFPDQRYKNPEAGLMTWLVWAVNKAALHERRDGGRIADLSPEAFDRLIGENAIDARVDLVAAQQEYAQLSKRAKTYARFRDQGLSRAEQRDRDFSVRQRNEANTELKAAYRRLAAFGPIPLIVGFFKRNSVESATAVGGGGAATTATVGGGAIAAKVGAVCAAGAICAGGVVGVVKIRDSEKPNKPVAAAKAPKAQQKLYTPIPKSTSSSSQTQKKKAARAARKQTDARKRDAARRQAAVVDNEFGVEAGSSSTESSPSSSSSSGSESTSPSKTQEFGVEAGQ